MTHRITRARLLGGACALLLLAACESKEEQAIKFAQTGHEYLDQGDLERAEIQFNNALFKDGQNVEALRGAAETARQKQETGRYASMLGRLLVEEPNDIPANVQYARLALLGGDGDRALEHAERVLAREADNAEALTVKGAALVVEGKLEEAQAVLNRALEQDPDNAEIFNLLAAREIRTEDYEAALARVNEGIAQAENPETLLIVKLILAERQLGDEAVIETFEQLIDAAPQNGLYRQRLADFVLLKGRDFDRARALYEEALPLVDDRTEIYTRLVAIDREQEGDAAAERTLLRLVDENPDETELRFTVPVFYCQTNQAAKCRAAYEALANDQGLEEDERLRARMGLSDVLIASGEVEEGEAIADAVLEADPNNVAALANKGQVLIARGEAGEAIPRLRTAQNNDPDNAEVLVLLALAYERDGQTNFADRQFAQAVDTVGYTKPLTDQYVAFLRRNGQDSRADEVLERYVEQNPNDLDAIIARARRDVAQRNFDRAIEIANRLETAGTRTEDAQRIRLAALAGQEDFETALPIADALLADNPDDRRLIALRTRLLTELGREEEALSALTARLGAETARAGDYVLAGEALMRAEEEARARAVARDGQERFPKSEDLYLVDYLATKATEGQEPAIAVLRRGVERAEPSRRLRVLLANDLILQGQNDDAIAVLRTLQADDALDDLTANNLASLLLEREGDEAEALQIAERFRGTENAYFADTLAWAYYKAGRLEDANRLSVTAAEGAPANPDILYHRGVIAAAQGDAPSARSAFTAARRALIDGAGGQVTEDEIEAELAKL